MNQNDPPPKPGGKPGRPRRHIAHRDRPEIARLVAGGYGLVMARRKLGISRRQYENTRERSPRFREMMSEASREKIQALEETAYLLALKGDRTLLVALLQRADRADQLALARRAAREAAAGPDREHYSQFVVAIGAALLEFIPPDRVPQAIAKVTSLLNEAQERGSLPASPSDPIFIPAPPSPGTIVR